ncbi:hypothetical protein OG394_06675 [Kribbella sp. NBC_01245]|uniref:hypothetical protein n=1 Tax=Kribbella sp. NBC_01245 TaxID=2903578 RepID=UPI002E2D9C0C|nr:hypothetical protein [Kribbella sp. NBC_01245]
MSARFHKFLPLVALAFGASALVAPPAQATAPTATAAVPTCKEIIISKYFDNDQTGGWWVTTTSMGCGGTNESKIYNLDVINTTTNHSYFSQWLGTKATSYVKTVIVPSVPPSRPEYACIIAHAELKIPYGSKKDKKLCWPIASPF